MSQITEMLTAAIAARKDSLKALRSRIAEILAPIPVGVVLSDEAGEVCEIDRICTGASQWSNRSWMVTIKGTGAIAAGKLLCEIDLDSSVFDGNNMHHRTDEPTCLYTGANLWDEGYPQALGYLSGPETRACALRLPAAIERYIHQCEAETAANAETLTA